MVFHEITRPAIDQAPLAALALASVPVVTVSVDAPANQIKASVRRSDLKGANGESVAVDGALLYEVALFLGIASCPGAGLIAGITCDTADADNYVLGTPRE